MEQARTKLLSGRLAENEMTDSEKGRYLKTTGFILKKEKKNTGFSLSKQSPANMYHSSMCTQRKNENSYQKIVHMFTGMQLILLYKKRSCRYILLRITVWHARALQRTVQRISNGSRLRHQRVESKYCRNCLRGDAHENS